MEMLQSAVALLAVPSPVAVVDELLSLEALAQGCTFLFNIGQAALSGGLILKSSTRHLSGVYIFLYV